MIFSLILLILFPNSDGHGRATEVSHDEEGGEEWESRRHRGRLDQLPPLHDRLDVRQVRHLPPDPDFTGNKLFTVWTLRDLQPLASTDFFPG